MSHNDERENRFILMKADDDEQMIREDVENNATRIEMPRSDLSGQSAKSGLIGVATSYRPGALVAWTR